MTQCINNPVFGRNLTDNFTFDETAKQVVPKKGTDTKAGVLALNLGNEAGDSTNATDALAAAGFNTMASATADPCGNAIQQAVTFAVGQSIACDTDAQEAIACAIANNPDAMACLKDKLPSGGAECSGSAFIYAGTVSASGTVTIRSTAGAMTLAASTGGVPIKVRALGNKLFVVGLGPGGNDKVEGTYAVDPTTGALTLVSTFPLAPDGNKYSLAAINPAGTKVLVAHVTNAAVSTLETTLTEFSVDAAGVLSTSGTVVATSVYTGASFPLTSYDAAFYYDTGDNIYRKGSQGALAGKLASGNFVSFTPVAPPEYAKISPNGQFFLRFILSGSSIVAELYSVSGTTTTLVNTSNAVPVVPGQGTSASVNLWSPDSKYALCSISPGSAVWTADISSGQVVLYKDRVVTSASNPTPSGLVAISPTGKYLVGECSNISGTGFNPYNVQGSSVVTIYQLIGNRYIQCSSFDVGTTPESLAITEL